MAKKEIIKGLRSFFKLQTSECKSVATGDDDSLMIDEILNEPNPGVVRAKEAGISITVAKGDTIYEIGADNTQTKIGSVKHKDVQIAQRQYSIQ